MNPMRALRQYQKVNSHAQISEASPHRLIQMLMEGGLDRMAQAKGALSRGDIAQKGLMLGKAIEIISGSHTADNVNVFSRFARELDFMASCGSDFHGPSESYIDLGRLAPTPQGLTPVWEAF